MLPFSYVQALLSHLAAQPDVRFLDFDDLAFPVEGGFSSKRELAEIYRREWRSYRRARRGSRGCDILLMHDCDAGPAETVQICRFEAGLGITSTAALFARTRRGDARADYPIDFDAMRRLQDEAGICIAYHCNAFHNADRDPERARALFEGDVRMLRDKGFRIRHFSAHGGEWYGDNQVDWPALTRMPLIWTHNRMSPSGASYSDSALPKSLARGSRNPDLKAFLQAELTRGNRLFLHMHPQYYFADSPAAAEPHFALNPWLEAVWNHHSMDTMDEYWAPIAVGRTSIKGWMKRLGVAGAWRRLRRLRTTQTAPRSPA